MNRDGILIVDDEPDARELIAEALTEEGYAVATAEDGSSALRTLATFSADLVLTDLRMPGMDGMELIRRLHEVDPGRPVLLMTGYGEPHRTRPGAVDLLLKPLELEQLVWIIDCALACRAASAR